MYFKLATVCIFHLLPVYGFEFLGINDGYRRLVKEIKSVAVLTGKPIVTRWIEQKLDHFDADEYRTWLMMYYERTDYMKPNGPVYLFLGGEAPAERGFLTTGLMYELAKATKGAMFVSEHRYYGNSQPVNRSKIEDMKFLSASQALADNANLLRTIKANSTFKKSKVVVVGGSYAGNLAAWMRLIYPDLVDAALASSGPVLAKRDFYEYLEVVNDDYEQYGTEGCLETIQNQFRGFETSFQTKEGVKQLKKDHNICEKSKLTKPENKQLFFMLKASYFMSNAQYGTSTTIKDVCSKLNDTKSTNGKIDDVPDDVTIFWNEERKCFDLDFYKMIKQFREEENDWMFCWLYQSCTEFGYFQTTTSDKQPFTNNIPIEWYTNLCINLFGSQFNEDKLNNGISKINKMYGGRSPNVTKVVFVNGALDPWSALGVLEDISYDAPAVVIPRSGHCHDLFSNSKGDHAELREARAHIKYLIKKWIRVGDYF